MKNETIVKGFRLRTETLAELEKIRAKKFGNFVKMNGHIQMILDQYIEREKKRKKINVL